MIDLDQATKDAIRTDLDYEAVKQRFHELGIGAELQSLLQEAAMVANALDDLKKRLFYGKNPRQGVPLATEQEDERTKECIRLVHGVVGIITEAGELAEALLHHIVDGSPLDVANIAEEVGDLTWYQRLICDEIKVSFQSIIETNVAKLKQRYPEKFTEDAALNRNLDAERQILEGK